MKSVHLKEKILFKFLKPHLHLKWIEDGPYSLRFSRCVVEFIFPLFDPVMPLTNCKWWKLHQAYQKYCFFPLDPYSPHPQGSVSDYLAGKTWWRSPKTTRTRRGIHLNPDFQTSLPSARQWGKLLSWALWTQAPSCSQCYRPAEPCWDF